MRICRTYLLREDGDWKGGALRCTQRRQQHRTHTRSSSSAAHMLTLSHGRIKIILYVSIYIVVYIPVNRFVSAYEFRFARLDYNVH